MGEDGVQVHDDEPWHLKLPDVGWPSEVLANLKDAINEACDTVGLVVAHASASTSIFNGQGKVDIVLTIAGDTSDVCLPELREQLVDLFLPAAIALRKKLKVGAKSSLSCPSMVTFELEHHAQ